MQKPVTPVVQIETPPNQEIGVADVLLGSVSIIGIAIVLALIAGLITGGLFIYWKRWRDRHAPDGEASTPHTRLDLSSH